MQKILKGSKTEANLMAAFAGESQARNKYTFYGAKAKADGFEQIGNLAHQGSFGMPVEVAVKADLSALNTNTLRFYNYDASTNVYTLIENSQYFIDTNGYLHFTTTVGGPVIVTDVPLTRR